MENCKDCHNCAFDLMCRNIGDWVGIRTPCSAYKDRSRFVELPDYKYSAEERFRGAVQELIDIAKASETPSKILQATSESLAHFACELSKLEEIKHTLKERENNEKL